jgi:hypothetical protein
VDQLGRGRMVGSSSAMIGRLTPSCREAPAIKQHDMGRFYLPGSDLGQVALLHEPLTFSA